MMPRGPARPSRRSWREAPYAALDFETTGLDFRRDAVVSIGVIPVLGGRVVMREAIHQLVAPAVAPSPRSQMLRRGPRSSGFHLFCQLPYIFLVRSRSKRRR